MLQQQQKQQQPMFLLQFSKRRIEQLPKRQHQHSVLRSNCLAGQRRAGSTDGEAGGLRGDRSGRARHAAHVRQLALQHRDQGNRHSGACQAFLSLGINQRIDTSSPIIIVSNLNSLKTMTGLVDPGLFWCFVHDPPNSDMNNRSLTYVCDIFACVSTTFVESAQNLTPGKSHDWRKA